MKVINETLCKLGYHKYLYDHPSQPTKCTCTRCDKKWKMVKNPDYIPNVTSPIETPLYIWEEVK